MYNSIKMLREDENLKNTGVKWTTDEDEELIKEITEKKTYEEIALNHKRTIGGITSRVISHIIYPIYKNNLEIDIDEIANKYNIDKEKILKSIQKLDTNNEKKILKSIKKLDTNNKDKNKLIKENNDIIKYLDELNNKINDINNKLDKLIKQ